MEVHAQGLCQSRDRFVFRHGVLQSLVLSRSWPKRFLSSHAENWAPLLIPQQGAVAVAAAGANP